MSLSVFEAARRAPHADALVCDGVRLSFAELAQRVQARRAELDALGVEAAQGVPVALIVEPCLALFEYLYLLFALGVPVLPIHPRLTAPERVALLSACGVRAVLDPSTAAAIIPAPVLPDQEPPLSERQALAFVPSSGSTGKPKIVELSRGAFLALARADAVRVPPLATDRTLLCLPLSHVGGLSVITRALVEQRCTVVFRGPSPSLLGSVPELAQALIDERISLLSLVPAVLARLLRAAPRIAELAPLRAVLLGGQACSAELFSEARARGVPVLTSYGLTEACSQVSTLGFPPPERAPVKRGVVGVGFPLDGIELRIVGDSIAVRGPTLLSGYVGQPSPLDGDGFFATGDRGELDPELGLFVFGRESELIISGGENIDPVEVEHALLACGGLSAVCVFGVPDPDFGERVAAAFEIAPPRDFDERALFAALDERLASFKQPRLTCAFQELPRLSSGKLDRAKIRVEAGPWLRARDRAAGR